MENSNRLDHAATWNEVCLALSFSFSSVFELGSACGGVREIEPDPSARVRILAEELAWLALASEVQAPTCN